MRVTITITGPQGSGKSLLAAKLKTFLEWLGVTNVKISERLP
jgi:pantothenate kinase-related protein Tda10